MTLRMLYFTRGRLMPRFFAEPLYQPLYHASSASASSADVSARCPQVSCRTSRLPLASAYFASDTVGTCGTCGICGDDCWSSDDGVATGALGHCVSSVLATSRPRTVAPGRQTLPC